MHKPIISVEGKYFLLDSSWLLEAMYESPFYWMIGDSTYKDTAAKNRGNYVEDFCFEQMIKVFGKDNVFKNVKIVKSGKELGEIDVLVIYSDRIVILQAKSKRMTEEARKGNSLKIHNDFQGAIQDSYDQSVDCAQLIQNKSGRLFTDCGSEIIIPTIKEYLLMCIVCDHYPALSYQVREYLTLSGDQTLAPPFVLDVFTLDAIAEMLDSPLHFLAYIRRRTAYYHELSSSHETVLLSDHIKRNLWLERKYNFAVFNDDIAGDLDIAMMVRRDGFQGERTPKGILTNTREGSLGAIFSQFERMPKPEALEFGFLILRCNGEALSTISRMIDKCCELVTIDGRNHDVSFPIEGEGLTIHANLDDEVTAYYRLKKHCERRMAACHASFWIGLLLNPFTKLAKTIICLGEADSEFKTIQKSKKKSIAPKSLAPLNGNPKSLVVLANQTSASKIGRNDPCPCGSNKKYKKCCLSE